MKPMTKGDLLQHILTELSSGTLASRGVIVDHVSLEVVKNIVKLLESESDLKPEASSESTDPDYVMAALLLGLAIWYAGGSMQGALDMAATLAALLEKETK